MNNGLIAIMDSEEEYAIRLADYFRIKSGLNYTIQVFTDFYSFLEYDKKNVTDILIVSELFGDYLQDLKNTRQIYILSEGTVDISLKEYSAIYKYQSSENIIREVMTNYAATALPENGFFVKEKKSRIIGVYSPVKRCGKSTFSLFLGYALKKKGRTLFISLEEYSSLSFFTGADYVGNLSDLIYFYKQTPYNLDKKIISLAHNYNGLEFIPPVNFPSDLRFLNGTQWCEFFNLISDYGLYDNIIIDISDSISGIEDVLSISDILYFPVMDDLLSQAKIDNFKSSMSLLNHSDIIDKLVELHLPKINVSELPCDIFNSNFYGSYNATINKILNSYE